jgi:Cu-Zn family superoxide dismutase
MLVNNPILSHLTALFSMLAFTACSTMGTQEQSVANLKGEGAMATKAIAVMYPTAGNTAKGAVVFSQAKDAISVIVNMEGLTPGRHGIHIHTYGDCSAPDASSAGDHLNPGDKPHAGPQDKDRHLGDLGNITANQEGKVNYETVDSAISLSGARNVIGRALVIHADPDDLKTAPSGRSGSRISCGVIGVANPSP